MDKEIYSLGTLPHILQLEIAQYLEINSLVSLSQVNRSFQNVSKSFKTYWISAIVRARLSLPLPFHIPLTSFTASELHLAVHKASFRERNLCSQRPRLYSHILIQWPFSQPRVIARESASEGPPVLSEEVPKDAFWENTSHHNGDWLFLVSSDAVVRVLHLRNGKLALEQKVCDIVAPTRPGQSRTACAVDFVGDSDVVMALVIDEAQKAESEEQEGDKENASTPQNVNLRILQFTLNPEISTASFTEIAKHELPAMPAGLDIAGDLVIYSIEYPGGHPMYRLEEISLLRWTDGVPLDLPPLLPSIRLVMFRGYFFSMGVVEPASLRLQVVSIPRRDQVKSETSASENETSIPQEEVNRCLLVATIRLRPEIREDKTIWSVHSTSVFMGKTDYNIIVWTRVGNANWNIFSLEVDFSKPPSRWFETSFPTGVDSCEGYNDTNFPPPLEYRRTQYHDNMIYKPDPAPPGKRFIWLTRDSISTSESEESISSSAPSAATSVRPPLKRYKLRLWASLIDYLPPIPNTVQGTGEYVYPMEEKWKKFYSHELEVPDEYKLGKNNERLISTCLEDRSGTVISTMSNGDIWVLRYGHS